MSDDDWEDEELEDAGALEVVALVALAVTAGVVILGAGLVWGIVAGVGRLLERRAT